ncbi:hypothetical protein CFOL_v3_11801 [Cephalotus follicularis]|uniref:Uncharacterized protein n=1 Tax=Cephalotus follicularis TaxID=3775 RepID=A0A1Q3BK49_CEPFO|nr:hypothetical protein CFOL_v3_11801 [Cephalotus follicularis]
MASSLNESTSPPNLNCSIFGDYYSRTLNQSIQKLLSETHKITTNISDMIDVFNELMQSKIDPPLESIWVYCALSFRIHKSANNDPLTRISLTKDLFQLVSACSGSCGSSKSIAMLAPVVLEVYKLFIELTSIDMGAKKEKKVIREVKSLIEVVLGYISVCCCKDLSEENDLDLVVSFNDLVGVWVDVNEGLESFLPLVSGEICREISERGCGVDYLAGVVIVEAFLLKLCFNFRVGIRDTEFEKELRSWVICSITRFRNFYFLETLVRMLLDPIFPVTSLLSSEDGLLLRKILYDTVILVEFLSYNPEKMVHIPAERMKSLAITRLIATYEAIEFYRKAGDQKRAISYTSAFSSSLLCSQIIKWIKSHIGMDETESSPNRSSPKALIKWLLNLEDRGSRVFDNGLLKLHAKSAIDNTKADYEQSASNPKGLNVDADLLFYIDKEGEEKDGDEEDTNANESISAAFVAAAHMMKTETEVKKRKESGTAGSKKKIKYLKYDICVDSDSAGKRLSSISNGTPSSDSEVEDTHSDEDADMK